MEHTVGKISRPVSRDSPKRTAPSGAGTMNMTKFDRNERNRRAFTLIELLVVILILSILMSVAMPLYLSVVSDAEVKVCRANMQTISNAEAAYKTHDSTHAYTTVLSN